MFHLSEHEIRLSRHLLRTLVFQPSEVLLGQRFVVERIEDFAGVAERLASQEQEAQLSTSIENIEATLIKYELADLHFSLVPPQNLGPAGASVLAALLADDEPRAPHEDKREAETRMQFLEDLVAETHEGALELVIFCQSRFLGAEARAKATQHWKHLPSGFFPREFEVTDAYITNAPTVGLFRNFYL